MTSSGSHSAVTYSARAGYMTLVISSGYTHHLLPSYRSVVQSILRKVRSSSWSCNKRPGNRSHNLWTPLYFAHHAHGRLVDAFAIVMARFLNSSASLPRHSQCWPLCAGIMRLHDEVNGLHDGPPCDSGRGQLEGARTAGGGDIDDAEPVQPDRTGGSGHENSYCSSR